MNQALSFRNKQELAQAWAALKVDEPKLRIRNAAEMLGVSELELLLTRADDTVLRIEPPSCFEFLQRLPLLGRVMALARNDGCVHERTGAFKAPKGNEKMALTLGIQDQRYFLSQWCYFFAVNEDGRLSIQIFDYYGKALWKIYALEATNVIEWKALVKDYLYNKNINIQINPASEVESSEEQQVSSEKKLRLLSQWAEMRDVHQFHGILKSLALNRRTAYELVSGKWTKKLDNESAETLLDEAREARVPLMVFTSNAGLVQIYTGTVSRLRRTGPWFNVLDANFNLHLNTSLIDSVWQVTRPSKDGFINSVECFDKRGNTIVTFFGERHEGEVEREDWREILMHLQGA